MPNPKLDAAIKNCKAYRKYLKDQKAPQALSSKGFLITKEMIKNIMDQSTDIAGIRIYVGLDETGAVKPYAVGCVQNGTKYNDYKIKKSGVGIPGEAPQAGVTSGGDATNTTLTALSTGMENDGPVVEEPRPCPSECGDDNDLNTGE